MHFNDISGDSLLKALIKARPCFSYASVLFRARLIQ